MIREVLHKGYGLSRPVVGHHQQSAGGTRETPAAPEHWPAAFRIQLLSGNKTVTANAL
jgi:hypothetical protein